MNTNFVDGFEKTALNIGHTYGRVTGAISKGALKAKRKVKAVPTYFKENARLGREGKKTKLSLGDAEKINLKREVKLKAAKTREINKASKIEKQKKQKASAAKGAETRKANAQAKADKKQAKVDAVAEKKSKEFKGRVKAIATHPATTITAAGGAGVAATKGLDKLEENNRPRHQYVQ